MAFTGSGFINSIGGTNIYGGTATGSAPFIGPVTPTINNSATSPSSPKAQYVQQQVQQVQPTQTPQPPANNGAGLSFMNGSINQQGQYVPNQSNQSTVQPNPQNQQAPSYDPYQSPAFQQYIQNAVQAASPAYTNPQIQQGIVGANTALQDIQTNVANSMGGLANKDLSSSGMTAQQALINQNAAYQSVPYQTQANLLAQQQQQAETAANIPLTAGTTEAGYLAGLAQPQSVSAGTNLTQLNPSTGQLSTLGGLPSFAAGTNTQTGAPYTYNQQTGAINTGGTNSGLGATPPALNGDVVAPSDPYYQTLQTYAGLLASNQPSAVPMGSLPPAVQAQVIRMAQAQGYNANTAAGTAAAQQSNVATAGTASVNANAAAYANSVPEVQNLNQALGNVTNLGNMTVQNAQGNNVNPFDFVPGNVTVAQARDLFSSTGQATFDSNITQLQAAIQSLYAQGGGNTPTNITSSINSLANGSLSMDGLKSLLSAAEAEGNVLLTTAQNKAISEFQNTQNGTQGVGDNGTSLYNF